MSYLYKVVFLIFLSMMSPWCFAAEAVSPAHSIGKILGLIFFGYILMRIFNKK
jgi:hypothetical protein